MFLACAQSAIFGLNARCPHGSLCNFSFCNVCVCVCVCVSMFCCVRVWDFTENHPQKGFRFLGARGVALIQDRHPATGVLKPKQTPTSRRMPKGRHNLGVPGVVKLSYCLWLMLQPHFGSVVHGTCVSERKRPLCKACISFSPVFSLGDVLPVDHFVTNLPCLTWPWIKSQIVPPTSQSPLK